MPTAPTHSTVQTPASVEPDGRLVVRAALAGFALMFVAGALLWLRYGPSVFFDALSYAAGCF